MAFLSQLYYFYRNVGSVVARNFYSYFVYILLVHGDFAIIFDWWTMSALVEGSGIAATVESTTGDKDKGEEIDQAPLPSAKVSESYIECKEQDLLQYSEDEEKMFIKEAIVKFNVKPKTARTYLVSKKMIQVRWSVKKLSWRPSLSLSSCTLHLALICIYGL